MQLSNLSVASKKELLDELNKMTLSYRKKLNIADNTTFGIEIEYGNVLKDIIDNLTKNYYGERLNNYEKWMYQYERSFANFIDKKYYGGEFDSPVFVNKEEYFIQLKNVCDALLKNGAIVDERMALHVHVGKDILKNNLKYLENFLKLYMIYEDIIYKFGYYGKTPRKVIDDYARAISYDLFDILEENEYSSFNDLIYILRVIFKNKKTGINFYNINPGFYDSFNHLNTIEYRMFNGTIDPVIIQNMVNLSCSLLETSASEELDVECIDYNVKKIKDREYNVQNLSLPINFDKALEFSDMIFKDDDDKKYFLKQYLM